MGKLDALLDKIQQYGKAHFLRNQSFLRTKHRRLNRPRLQRHQPRLRTAYLDDLYAIRRQGELVQCHPDNIIRVTAEAADADFLAFDLLGGSNPRCHDERIREEIDDSAANFNLTPLQLT